MPKPQTKTAPPADTSKLPAGKPAPAKAPAPPVRNTDPMPRRSRDPRTLALRVFCYDIADAKKRNRIAKVLEAVGDRVQYSVFRAHLTDDEVQVVLARLERRMDRATDRIHVYTLCGACVPRIRTVGTDLPVERSCDIF